MTNLYYRLRYWLIAARCRIFSPSLAGGLDIREYIARAECDPHMRALLNKRRRERVQQRKAKHKMRTKFGRNS